MRELALLSHIYGRSRGLGEGVVVGPGDDMALLRVGGAELLAAVDQIADTVHFDTSVTPLHLIARKAMTRNLSDVAAMAALPTAALASVMLPKSWPQDRAESLFNAMQQVADHYNCPLVGGDIGAWQHPLQLSVTILAEPAGVRPVLRSTAKPGDAVFVTGSLGHAWQDGGTHHLTFEPRIRLARSLAATLGPGLHSMIDLSDGLASDLTRICERSDVAAQIETRGLPLRSSHGDPQAGIHSALHDGEDYELCFTVDPVAARDLPGQLEGVSLTRVGDILRPPPDSPGAARLQLRWPDGRITMPEQTGYEHGRDA